MNRSCALVGVLLLALWFGGCETPRAQRPTGTPAAAAGNDVDAMIARMTVEQKAAQIMVVGFDGSSYDPGCREMVEKFHVGGVILFARNVESPNQVARVINALQASALASSGIGLFTAIDQEGGRVARFAEKNGFTEFPGAMALGAAACNQPDGAVWVKHVAAAMAEEMRAVGINTDFAPDLDVNNNPANPVIGIRSFGSDPRRVATLGVAFMDGLQANGVLAFGKHFPGHGDTAVDSHAALPVVAHDRARLEAVEFVPFKAAIAKHIAGIMTAHVSFPTIDPTPHLPGTLSTKVLTDLLRRDLRFQGLIITDSLEMGALEKSGFPGPQAAARALQAGADLLLFNNGYALHQAAIRQIAADVRNGAIPSARLDEAVRRVLEAKIRFGLLHPLAARADVAADSVGTAAHRALAREVAAKAITIVRDDAGRVPFRAGASPVVIVTASATGLAAAIHGTEVRVGEVPTKAEMAEAMRVAAAHSPAPVVVGLSGARPNGAQANLAIKLLQSGAPVVLVALRDPYDLLSVPTPAGPRGPTLIATYGANPATLDALAGVLRGNTAAGGHLPVELPGRFPVGTGVTNVGVARRDQVVP